MSVSPSYPVSDLPIREGVAYHLGISAEQLSDSILIVGDPERVDTIADNLFERVEARVRHRGLTTVTGVVRETGQRVTCTTSGMGAPSTEIVLNELMALAEFDTKTRARRSQGMPLTIIRLGTSGALQGSTALGTAVITSHAVGFDSSAWFYAAGMTDDALSLELASSLQARVRSKIARGHRAEGKLLTYGARATPAVVAALTSAAVELGVSHEIGVTVTASGFFAPQGRDVGRIPATVPDIDRLIAEDARFLNMDMETAFLLHFCGGHGYPVGAICVAAANRELNAFATDTAERIHGAARVALLALKNLKREIPEVL